MRKLLQFTYDRFPIVLAFIAGGICIVGDEPVKGGIFLIMGLLGEVLHRLNEIYEVLKRQERERHLK